MNLDWYKNQQFYNERKKFKTIIFVCLGNTCRSPAAEYFFRHRMGWFSGLKVSSRGLKVDVDNFLAAPEIRKVIGDNLSRQLIEHKSRKLSEQEAATADLILALDRSVAEQLRENFPNYRYKIFTLIGFVQQSEDSMSNNDVPNPYIPISKRTAEETLPRTRAYYKYIQNYVFVLDLIKKETGKLAEIIYLLNREKKYAI